MFTAKQVCELICDDIDAHIGNRNSVFETRLQLIGFLQQIVKWRFIQLQYPWKEVVVKDSQISHRCRCGYNAVLPKSLEICPICGMDFVEILWGEEPSDYYL